MPPEQQAVRAQLARYQELGQRICHNLMAEVQRAGIGIDKLPAIELNQASFSLKRDPFSGEDSLEGSWYGPSNNRVGSILFHADGSFFAEYDVVKPHPTKSRWFVEAVTAWGKGNEIKSELRLLPIIG